MNRLTGEFVAMIARVWHRFEPPAGDAETLAGMLVPMDEAGEALAGEVEFDMEPSDYLAALERLAEPDHRR